MGMFDTWWEGVKHRVSNPLETIYNALPKTVDDYLSMGLGGITKIGDSKIIKLKDGTEAILKAEKPKNWYNEFPDVFEVNAYIPGSNKQIGTIGIYPNEGGKYFDQMYVDKGQQRKGLATEMANYGMEGASYKPYPVATTDEGKKFMSTFDYKPPFKDTTR